MSIFAAGTPALPLTEAELLAISLIADPTSRIHAAASGWPMRLPLWLQIRSVAALAGLAGADPRWPWDDTAEASEDEKAAATALLMERWG